MNVEKLLNHRPSSAGEVWKLSQVRRGVGFRNAPPTAGVLHHIVVTTLEPINVLSGDWTCLVMLDTWRDESKGRADRGTGQQARFRIRGEGGWEKVS